MEKKAGWKFCQEHEAEKCHDLDDEWMRVKEIREVFDEFQNIIDIGEKDEAINFMLNFRRIELSQSRENTNDKQSSVELSHDKLCEDKSIQNTSDKSSQGFISVLKMLLDDLNKYNHMNSLYMQHKDTMNFKRKIQRLINSYEIDED
jgi:hypothetical protein